MSEIDENSIDRENDGGNSNVRFTWIAMDRKHTPDVLSKYLDQSYGQKTFRSIYPEWLNLRDKNDPQFYYETPLPTKCPDPQTNESKHKQREKEKERIRLPKEIANEKNDTT